MNSAQSKSRNGFTARLLAWYDAHGRKTLPWKRKRDAYRIWVSEVMLQQTQVATVIPYFERFIERFPDVASLARARADSVLHVWTGLGYYARARNLHAAAKKIMREHGGRFPRRIDAVCELPGIGRSTAGAILSLAFDQRHPILDGNVKRVLARHGAIGEPVNQRDVEQQLWKLADRYTPAARVADYTQAIMDLGATVCRRSKPDCTPCPVRIDCKAYALGRPEDFPVKTSRAPLPVRTINWLLLRNRDGHVLLERRPPAGLWGGLWAFPETAETDVKTWARGKLGMAVKTQAPWPAWRHTFSHFHLDITPIPATLVNADGVMEKPDTLWYNVRSSAARGVSAPVKKLLEQLK